MRMRLRNKSAVTDSGACENHQFDDSSAACRDCRGSYCADCVVYPFGPRKAALCIRCALVVAGIRSA